MPQVSANGIQIEATRTGDENAPAILLIRGLGTQMCQWPAPFLNDLARDFQVVTFDNRDVGLNPWVRWAALASQRMMPGLCSAGRQSAHLL